MNIPNSNNNSNNNNKIIRANYNKIIKIISYKMEDQIQAIHLNN